MDIIIKKLLEITIYSSAMIVTVFGIKKVMGKRVSTEITMILWILVLARLLLPVTFASPYHLDGIAINRPDEKIAVKQTQAKNEPSESVEHIDFAAYDYQDYSFDETAPVNTQTQAPPAQKTVLEIIVGRLKKISVTSALFAIWITGIVAVAANFLKTFIRFEIRMKKNRPIPAGGLKRMTEKMRKSHHIGRKVRIYESDYIDAPITVGVFSPKILLPADFSRNIAGEKLRLIVKHELMHIKRQDILKNYLWLIAKTVYWFNPLVWLAYQSFLEDVELLCDERVLKNSAINNRAVYSQGLVDVVKLSGGQMKLPVAMPFCKNKTKIRKRVENMLKPTKKLRSAGCITILLAIIMAAGCFTTACQPTPEELIVQNKADGELESAIAQTAEPTAEEDIAPNNDEDSAVQEPVQQIFVEDASQNPSGTVTVNINAEVINNQPENIPVAQISPYYFTAEDVQTMINSFWGNKEIYKTDLIKADFDYLILKKQYQLNDEQALKAFAEERDITDLSAAKKRLQDAIERFIKGRNNASETRSQISSLDSLMSGEGNAVVEISEGHLGYLTVGKESVLLEAFEDDAKYAPERYLVDFAQQIDLNNDDTQFQKAKIIAMDLIESMGIKNVTLGDAYLTPDIATINQQRDDVKSGREFYVFCFEKVIGNSKLDHTIALADPTTYFTMDPKDPDSQTDEVYAQVREHEKLEVWVEGEKLVQFQYSRPMQVTSIVNDNVAISLDYTKAMEIAKQYAHVTYIDPHKNFSEVKVNIDKIELVLVREKHKDSSDYIVVPAWNFYGKLEKKCVSDDSQYKAGEWKVDDYNCDYPLMTVNALDGSVQMH